MTRLFDVLFSLIGIAVLFPLLLPIMILLKLTGEHYIFYQQPRVGLGGRDFMVLKFATMLKDSPTLPGGVLTQKNDPRILPLGGFLRRTKINELPQLVNILIGQMSFVGPRPQARRHYELYSPRIKSAIDQIRPGLTGLGSVVFRDEESILDCVEGDRDKFHDSVIAPYKGELEIWYHDHQSIRLYFMLFFLTAWAVIRPSYRVDRAILRDLPEPPEALAGLLHR